MKKVKLILACIISLIFSINVFSQGLEYRKTFKGLASFYGNEFKGKTTANGEVFNPKSFTCAHRYLPFGTLIEVENLRNGKKVIVRVNDRGPFSGDRVIDLSKEAAKRIGIIGNGVAEIKARVLKRRKGFDIQSGILRPDLDAVFAYNNKNRYNYYFKENSFPSIMLKR